MLEKSVVKLTLMLISVYFISTLITSFGLSFYNVKRMQLQEEEKSTEIARLMGISKAKISINSVNVEQLKCLAMNIYYEAGTEPFMGQVAVARVVMNRIKHGFASNPCRVIYQALNVPHPENPEEKRKVCQFSWVCENKPVPSRNPVYLQAEQIARAVLSEDKWKDEIPNNVLFFHNTSVNPNWAYHRVMTIGNHIFYGKGKPKQ